LGTPYSHVGRATPYPFPGSGAPSRVSAIAAMFRAAAIVAIPPCGAPRASGTPPRAFRGVNGVGELGEAG